MRKNWIWCSFSTYFKFWAFLGCPRYRTGLKMVNKCTSLRKCYYSYPLCKWYTRLEADIFKLNVIRKMSKKMKTFSILLYLIWPLLNLDSSRKGQNLFSVKNSCYYCVFRYLFETNVRAFDNYLQRNRQFLTILDPIYTPMTSQNIL